jgi:ribosomal RNA-processing protein 17
MEEEYEDEDMLATVTVVEDFDPDTFLHGPRLESVPTPSVPSGPHTLPGKLKLVNSERPKKKPKPKKVRYETKDERKVERTKQRARRTEKAELAGGKAARKKGPQKKKGNARRN